LLARIQRSLAGDIYLIAAKIHVISAFEACRGNTLHSAAWNVDKTALDLIFNGGVMTTLLAEGWRLVTKCGCDQWQPARNCPHVVIAWAALKRLVSPEALSHMKINKNMLDKLKRFIEQEPAATVPTIGTANESRQKAVQPPSKQNPAYRLVISTFSYNSLSARVMRGDSEVGSWSPPGLPPPLVRFLLSHYYYEPSPEYYEAFLAVTKSAYPIVYRDQKGRSTELAYRNDMPATACISFDIVGDEVILSRCLDNGRQIPDDAILHGQLLISPTEGAMYPVINNSAWRLWDEVVDHLESDDDDFDEDYDMLDDTGDEDDYRPQQSMRRVHHGVAVPMELFNYAGVRLDGELLDHPDGQICFLLNNSAPELPKPITPSYLLDIPAGLKKPTTFLKPVGIDSGQDFDCSPDVFRLVMPAGRRCLSGPMKTKKRLRAVLETAFRVMDEKTDTKRTAIIRQMTATPDFAKHGVKREAKQLVLDLKKIWEASALLLKATPEGWRLVQEEYLPQAQLMRVQYEAFGLDSFDYYGAPGGMAVPHDLLVQKLPELLAALRSKGFSLRMRSTPMATAEWSFSLDATRSTLDWFELKPEIRCDGELLTVEELRELFGGDGLLHRNGQLIMLDETNAQVLSMFAEIVGGSQKKRKNEQEPVRVPRLLILDWLQLRQHGVSVRLSQEDSQILESLLNFESIPARHIPDGLKASLRHYQEDAWRWLAFLYEHRFGACLADDMGLGKTLQGITLLAGIQSRELTSPAPPGTPHLVVAPPSLLFNWEAELTRFLPAANVMIYAGSGRSIETFSAYDVIITSYGIVQRDIEVLEQKAFNVIIFDEAQMVKNLQAATSNAVRRLKGNFTLALTGTPLENHLGEYYAIMDLCVPGLLGTKEEFGRALGKAGADGAARLIGRTRPFVLRRTKQLIASELPPKIEIDIPLELTLKQKTLYQRTVEEVRGQVMDAYANHAPAQARIIALTAILRLRQICLSPSLAAPAASEASPKLEFLAEQLEELRYEGHCALVFSQFTSYLDLVEKDLKGKGFAILRLDGSTPVAQRKKLVQTFQNSAEPTVFLISLKAGGKGLNLTRASYVYHMDPWWNPAVEDQASDRAHRIGQTAQVTITRLIMRHTIEEKMMELKARKKQLYKAILEDGVAGGGASLTREDFEFLLEG
jgi:non-specific serine/threonine protein kinase